MARIAGIVRYVLTEFGPLLAFWILATTFGVKPAIAGSLVVIIADAVWRRVRQIAFTRVYLLASGLTLVFGAIDLMAATPFMLKYEAVVTNFATGVFFVVGTYGERPLVQEAAEQRQGAPYPAGADVRRFFQLFTLLWAAYFFLKSGLYLWFAVTLSLTQAMAARSLVGSLSLAAMTGFSFALGPRLFFLCQKWGLLPSPDEETKAARLAVRAAEAASHDRAAAPGSLS